MKLFNSLTARLGTLPLAVLMAASAVPSAFADWSTFWHNLHVGYARNNAWPDPFNELDAAQVIMPFERMKANGWRMHNTIGHELFRQGDGALLAAGHRKVRWIATQAPLNRREVHVLRGASAEETQARVASVRSTLAHINYQGPEPAVLVTDIEPATSSGAIATKINREMLENLPEPRLPDQSSSGQQGVATPTN